MLVEKYNPNSLSVSAILGLIASGDIAIPEIQRPFVWKKKQVRDLLDSLYKGYPTGYLIIWKNPNVKLKDGSVSAGKKILIDGQQRVTALMTAIAGIPVINSDYKKERVKIAFNPFEALSEDKDAEIFAVQDQSHLKGKKWIPDVAEIFKNDFSVFSFISKYCNDNPDMEPETLDKIPEPSDNTTNNIQKFKESIAPAIEAHNKLKDSIAPIIEQNQKWQDNISPIIEQQANIQALASSVIPAAEIDHKKFLNKKTCVPMLLPAIYFLPLLGHWEEAVFTKVGITFVSNVVFLL